MKGQLIEGAPYLTQVELKENELRELYSKVYTPMADSFRQATEAEIAEVQERKNDELEIMNYE